jgi:hypothetical protein
VFSTGGSNVTVVVSDCCYFPSEAVVFNSTNGGKTFGAETEAGNISGINTATYADGELVVAPNDNGGGTQLQAFSPHPSGIDTTVPTLNATAVEDIALSTYKDGVLVASGGGNDSRVW